MAQRKNFVNRYGRDYGGRPPKYDTPEELSKAIDDYFDWCAKNKKPKTWERMCLFLGFSSKGSLYEYEKRNGFSEPITKARLEIEAERHEQLLDEERRNVRGVEFSLINNHSWTNGKTEHMLSGELNTKVIRLPAKAEEGAPLDLGAPHD